MGKDATLVLDPHQGAVMDERMDGWMNVKYKGGLGERREGKVGFTRASPAQAYMLFCHDDSVVYSQYPHPRCLTS
jgi:hypothetical protein